MATFFPSLIAPPQIKAWVTPAFFKVPGDRFFLTWIADRAFFVRSNFSSRILPARHTIALPRSKIAGYSISITAVGWLGSKKLQLSIPESNLFYGPDQLAPFSIHWKQGNQLCFQPKLKENHIGFLFGKGTPQVLDSPKIRVKTREIKIQLSHPTSNHFFVE